MFSPVLIRFLLLMILFLLFCIGPIYGFINGRLHRAARYNIDYSMDMIGHDNIIINGYIFVLIRYIIPLIINYFTDY